MGYPSLDLLYDEIKNQLSTQFTDIDALNNKASIIAGLDGVIIAALVQSLGDLTSLRSATSGVPQQWLLLSMLMLVISSVMALIAYWARKYKGIIEPRGAHDNLLLESPEMAKIQLIHTWIDSYEKNKKMIDAKAFFIKMSLLTLIIAIGLVCLFMCLSILMPTQGR